MNEPVSERSLKDAHCWEAVDAVPGRAEMTAFRRRLRYHQARWREAQGHPIGSQPISTARDSKPPRPLGSRLPLDYARKTGANFLTTAAHDAVRARLAAKERHQMLAAQRLWADLLSSMPMCFNLFGHLWADHELADRAVQTWWPDAPGTVGDVRFEHSPGRLDRTYLGNLSAFDVAIVLDRADGARGIAGIETKYHERAKAETPKPSRLPRYVEVAERSGVFAPGWLDAVNGTDLLQVWLDHLLVLSMLQHPDGNWTWGRFVVVYPAGNTDFADACARYRHLLVDDSTFSAVTIEDLLDAGALPDAIAAAFRARYLPQ